MNKPVFVVGSPRSGTSILTWCLGQHSNILVQEESDWLGLFALHVEIAYRAGTRRGERSQLGSLNVQHAEFFNCFGRAIDELIVSHRGERTRVAREEASKLPPSAPGFQTERSSSDPKGRWVDGTPEYSFYICGLRKLFPDAVFIHMLRDPVAVVRSMVNFTRTGGPALVEDERQAYDYWLRAVRACAQAERAYGLRVVYRMLHSDLVDNPESTLRSLCAFLQEPYEPACLEPLGSRINSSNVSSDFESATSDSSLSLLEEARQLHWETVNAPPATEPSSAAAAELESAFQERVHYLQNASIYHKRAVARVKELEMELEKLKSTLHASPRRWSSWFQGKQARA